VVLKRDVNENEAEEISFLTVWVWYFPHLLLFVLYSPQVVVNVEEIRIIDA